MGKIVPASSVQRNLKCNKGTASVGMSLGIQLSECAMESIFPYKMLAGLIITVDKPLYYIGLC